jgi:protein involved in polysaccharide export with SLBB domain
MNLLSKLFFSFSPAVLAALVLSGCQSAEEPIFTDNPTAPVTATSSSSPTNDTPSLTEESAARFAPGETVTVASTTGSDSQPGPIATAGQPFLINDDGTITLPLVGAVQAGGKTPGELQGEIEKLYVPEYFVRLTITVTAQNRVYYVGGEVNHPGPEVYIGKTTVSTAIQAAGDFTQFANHTVWLTRGSDGTRTKVNVDHALSDSTQDPPVFPGDKIEVHRRIF